MEGRAHADFVGLSGGAVPHLQLRHFSKCSKADEEREKSNRICPLTKSLKS
jgi:hypothetical protein